MKEMMLLWNCWGTVPNMISAHWFNILFSKKFMKFDVDLSAENPKLRGKWNKAQFFCATILFHLRWGQAAQWCAFFRHERAHGAAGMYRPPQVLPPSISEGKIVTLFTTLSLGELSSGLSSSHSAKWDKIVSSRPAFCLPYCANFRPGTSGPTQPCGCYWSDTTATDGAQPSLQRVAKWPLFGCVHPCVLTKCTGLLFRS